MSKKIRMIAVSEYEPDTEDYPIDLQDSIESMAELDFEAFQNDAFFFFDLDNVSFDYEVVE